MEVDFSLLCRPWCAVALPSSRAMFSQPLSQPCFPRPFLPLAVPAHNRTGLLLCSKHPCVSRPLKTRIGSQSISQEQRKWGQEQRTMNEEESEEYIEEDDLKGEGEGEGEEDEEEEEEEVGAEAKGSYAGYAAFLEEAFKDDRELQTIIGNMIEDPEEMQKKVHERFKRKEKDILQQKTGSPNAMKVSFVDFDATDSYVWIELYNDPSDKEIDIIGSVIRSWYLLGCLGGYNSLNMQLTRIPVNDRLTYNENVEDEFLPARFHNIGELEFQHNWGRFWVDLGTSDPLALDVFINSFIAVSSDYVGIKQVTFGGKDFGNWNEDLASEEDGYKSFRI